MFFFFSLFPSAVWSFCSFSWSDTCFFFSPSLNSHLGIFSQVCVEGFRDGRLQTRDSEKFVCVYLLPFASVTPPKSSLREENTSHWKECPYQICLHRCHWLQTAPVVMQDAPSSFTAPPLPHPIPYHTASHSRLSVVTWHHFSTDTQRR